MAKIRSTKTKKVVGKAKAAGAKSSPAKKKTSPSAKASSLKPARKTTGKKPAAAPQKITKKSVAAKEAPVKPAQDSKKLSPRDRKIQEIKLKLLRQRASLLNEAESALNELPGQTTFPDLGDQATAETDRNFMLRLRGREQRLLKKIDEAIDRIDTGIFGICDDCGNEIDVKRLEARPVTTMCIECKTLQEEEEKLREQ